MHRPIVQRVHLSTLFGVCCGGFEVHVVVTWPPLRSDVRTAGCLATAIWTCLGMADARYCMQMLHPEAKSFL